MDDSQDIDRQLVDAVRRDDIEKTKHLLEKEASVNARNEQFYKETVLMRACANKNKAMVELLLNRRAAVNETDWAGQTALMYAAISGDKEIIDLLLEHDAAVMEQDNLGRTVFHFAVANNHKTIVDRLMCCWELTVDIDDKDGKTPLWWAACGGHIDCVDVLLVHGANPGHKSKNNESPLDIARAKGHNIVVSLMIEALACRSHQYVVGITSELERKIQRHEEKIQRQETQLHQLNKENEQLQKEIRRSVQQQQKTRQKAEIQQKELLSTLSSVTIAVEGTDRQADELQLPNYSLPVNVPEELDLLRCSSTGKAFLADQGWEHDVFICHSGADKPFVETLYHEMQKCDIHAFFYQELLEEGDTIQMSIAHTIISAPFCVVVLSDSFHDQPYPEAEATAALAFSKEHKTTLPVFYKMTIDDCHQLTRKLYQELADMTGWERQSRTDEEFAKAISQDMKHRAENQLYSEEMKLWKPKGEEWKPKREIGLQLLTQLEAVLNAERESEDGLFLTFNTTAKSSDGTVLPVTSSVSNEIGPEGGNVQFQTSGVFLGVPQGAVPSPTTFYLETYVDPAHLPPVTSKDEVPLSPAFHLSSSLPQDHHFERPFQLSLPLEVPLRAGDHNSGWLLQLKRSRSSDGLAGEWHTVLELNTETDEVVSQSSFLRFDHAHGTLHLDQFSCFAWLGKPFRAIRSKLGFNPVRKINYTVFGKQIQSHKWCIATHIIHGSNVIYESLVRKLKEKDYVELTHPKSDCIRSRGKVSVCIQCLEPWHVRLGKKDVQMNTNQIWRSGQHSSCYHEVTVEDSSFEADTLECTIEASFWAKEDRDCGDSVELVVSRRLQLTKPEAGFTALLSDSRVFQAVLKYGVEQWYSIGLEMGFTGPQIKACTFDIPSHDSKLQAIIQQKVCECGVNETEKCVLAACEGIPQPIIGSVLEDIEGGSNGMSQHEIVDGDSTFAGDSDSH